MQSQSHQLQNVTTVQEVTTEKVDNTTQTEQSQIQQLEEVTTVTTEQVDNTSQIQQLEEVTTVTTEQVDNTSQIQQLEEVTTVTTEQVDNTSQIQQLEEVTTVTTEQVDNTSQIQQLEEVTTVTTEQVDNTSQIQQLEEVTTVTTEQVDNTSQIQQLEEVTTVTTEQVDNTSQIQQLEEVTTVTTEQVDSTMRWQSLFVSPVGPLLGSFRGAGVGLKSWGFGEETGAEDIIPFEHIGADPRGSRMFALAVRKVMLKKSQASHLNSVTIGSNAGKTGGEKTSKDMIFLRRKYEGFYLYEMVEPLPGEHHLQVEFISSATTLTVWRPLRLTRVPLITLTVDQLVNIVDEHVSFLLGNSVPMRCGVTTKICREGKDLSEFRTSSLRALGLQGRRIGFREQAPQADVQCYLQCTI